MMSRPRKIPDATMKLSIGANGQKEYVAFSFVRAVLLAVSGTIYYSRESERPGLKQWSHDYPILGQGWACGRITQDRKMQREGLRKR